MELPDKVRRAFFAKYGGRLRSIQTAALEDILKERDALVMAATASGKTEAVFLPIVLRLLGEKFQDEAGLSALVVSPTRALASDLYDRMAPVFGELGLRLGVATSDRKIAVTPPPHAMIRTPEGIDFDLCRRSSSLCNVADVVIDELHLFLDSPRGTQLAGLLVRLTRISDSHRRIGLSATISNTESPANIRLLRNPIVVSDNIEKGSPRVIWHTWYQQRQEHETDRFIARLRREGVRKAIGFTRSRARAEKMAHLLNRGFLSRSSFSHHADLSSQQRREIEDRFRRAKVGLIVATSTLEVGVDIGSIDTCILFDVPPSHDSFVQRTGRAGRRSNNPRVVCVTGKYNARRDFTAVMAPPAACERVDDSRPYLSGVLQQIVSNIVQYKKLTRMAVHEFCRNAFCIDDSRIDTLLDGLIAEDVLSCNGEQLALASKGKELAESEALHCTFVTGGGTRVIDQPTGKVIGKAALPANTAVILGGTGRRVIGFDKEKRAALTVKTAGGEASFAARPKSAFESLSLKLRRRMGVTVKYEA